MRELEAAGGKLESGARKTQPHTPRASVSESTATPVRVCRWPHSVSKGRLHSSSGAIGLTSPKQSWLLPPPPPPRMPVGLQVGTPAPASADSDLDGTRTASGGPGPCGCCLTPHSESAAADSEGARARARRCHPGFGQRIRPLWSSVAD